MGSPSGFNSLSASAIDSTLSAVTLLTAVAASVHPCPPKDSRAMRTESTTSSGDLPIPFTTDRIGEPKLFATSALKSNSKAEVTPVKSVPSHRTKGH